MMKVQNTQLSLRQMMIIQLMTEMCAGINSENEKNVYRVLYGKPQCEIPPGRRRSGWKNGIKVDIKTLVVRM
jgi:hypothetical protein